MPSFLEALNDFKADGVIVSDVGVIDLAKNVFKTSSVRLGIPEILGNETSDYRSPEFATVIGIVENAFKEPKNSNRVVTKNEKKKENKLRTFFKTFF